MHTSLPPSLADSTATVTPQPVTLPILPPALLSVDKQQAHLIRELSKLNVLIDEVMQEQPNLDDVFQQHLAAIFSDIPRPIDPNRIFYTRYRNNDQGQAQRLSSEPLGALLNRLRGADADAYLSEESGAFYSERDTLEADKRLAAVDSIATLAARLEVAITLSLNEFWGSAPQAQFTPQERLVAVRRQVLAHQLALRSVDGTLSADARALADKVLKYPSALAREQAFSADHRPAAYRLALEDGSEFAGTFILSDTGGTPPTGTVLLYSPGEGFEEYASLERLHQAVANRLRDGGSAATLLNASLPKTARTALSGAPVLAANPPLISADVVADTVHSLRTRQHFSVREALRREALPEQGTLELAADLKPQLDAAAAFTARNLRLLELPDPAWLTAASAQDQAHYRQLEQAVVDSNEALIPLLKNISALPAYAQKETEAVLKRQKPTYAGVDIAPYRSLVRLRASSSLPVKVKGYRDAQSATVYISADRKIDIPLFLQGRTLTHGTWTTQVVVDLRTLGSYAQRNIDPWSIHNLHRTITATAEVIDTSGEHRGKLGDADLRALAQEVDIGQKYAAYLRAAFAQSADGRLFATAWQRASAAKMNKDALESRLNPAVSKLFIFQTPGSGFDWIKAVTQYPDSATRPRVGEFEIEVNSLVLGGGLEGGQGGQVLNRVLVIQRKGTGVDGVSLLYTPDAPDGAPFRELVNGLAEIDTLKAKPQWRTYFTQRMATNDTQELTQIFNDTRGAHRYTLKPITADFHAQLYSAQLGFQLSHADFRSRTNAQISRESAVNAFMFGADVADLLIDLVPGRAALSLLRRSISRGLRLSRQLGQRIPGLVKKIGMGQKNAGIALASASVRPLEPAWVNVAAYRLPQPIDAFFDLEMFAQANHYRLSRKTGSAPCFYDKHNNQFVAMREETGRYYLFESYVEDGARYVKDPAGSRVGFMVVPGDEKSWKPRFERTSRGGGSVLGALRATPEQQVDADLLAALRAFSTEAELRKFATVIDELTGPQKEKLLANARQYLGADVDQAAYRRLLAQHSRLSERAQEQLRDGVLLLRTEMDIYLYISKSTEYLVHPLSTLDKERLFKQIKRIIGKNDDFTKRIRASIRLIDPDTEAEFVGYAITQKQANNLDKFDKKYGISTWMHESLNAFLNEKGRKQVLAKIATDNNITRQEALELLLTESVIQDELRRFRKTKFKEKIEQLGVSSYSEDFKTSGVPYIVISRGKHTGPDAGVNMIDSVSVANFEKNLPRFSTPLEFDRPRAQTHKVEKPPSGTDLGVTVPAPPRDPVVNRVELDELAATQKPLLPDNARSKLEEIIQDIQAGRVSRKKIGNYSYVDLPQVDTGSGRGRWRVAIEKGGKTNGHDIFIVRGIYDYHGSKPVAWGM